MFALRTFVMLAVAVIAALAPIVSAQEVAVAPGADAAEKTLADSPRHGEFVNIDLPGSDVKLRSWVVYPERDDDAPVVIVIHEIFGLTDWIRSVADHLASQGFIAIAPDLISGKEGADGENVTGVVRAMENDEVVERLNAVMNYGLALPSANGSFATIGFCWGGSTSFMYATRQPELDAAVVYYGSSPDTDALKNINAPVLGLYGEMDNRVNATIPDAAAEMKRLGKTYETHTFQNGGHGFLRAQDGRDGANLAAAQKAWPLTVEFLRKHTAK